MKLQRLQSLLLIQVLVLVAGCAHRIQPNPLEGWKGLGSEYRISCPFGREVVDNYKNYIQTLPAVERAGIDTFNINFFERGDHMRAVGISVSVNGIRWEHILIYNQDNLRVKVIKYASGKYQ